MLQDAEVMPLHAEAAPLYAEVMLLHAKPMQEKEKAATKIRNCFFFQGGANGIRTSDTRIFSPMLYQLSYGTIADLRVTNSFARCKKRVSAKQARGSLCFFASAKVRTFSHTAKFLCNFFCFCLILV